MSASKVIATGSYVPNKTVPNSYFEKQLETSDEWIIQRTGIKERRFANIGTEATSDLAAMAGSQTLLEAGVSADRLDAIVVATSSPDYPSPTSAALVQEKIGATKAFAFDLAAACAGSVYALQVADSLLRANNRYQYILVIGAEIISTHINWQDRASAVLFGDGAGAVLLERKEEAGGFMDFELKTDGAGHKDLLLPIGGSKEPITKENAETPGCYVCMNGREVYKKAVISLVEASTTLLSRNKILPSEIDHVIAHQANLRIVEAVAKKLEIPLSKWPITIDKYGNTSAASLFLSWDKANKAKLIHPDQKILLMAIGAGFTWGAGLYNS